jgi:hypothetical protein
MYYIASVNDMATPIDPELDNLSYEAAMSWMENVGNIIEYTIVQRG